MGLGGACDQMSLAEHVGGASVELQRVGRRVRVRIRVRLHNWVYGGRVSWS